MSFTSNIQITKNYPGVLYDATEPSGVWHEDHEVNGIRYHAVNATFTDTTTSWSSVNKSQPAYAIAQNTDGSISYLYMPPTMGTWATWQGAGQPLIYHAVNYGMSPGASATTNTAALQAAATAAVNGGGGVIFIPAGVYQISGTINVSGPDNGLIITGVGGSTQLAQQDFVDVFSVSSLSSGRGVRFRDLRISYAMGTVGPPMPPAAIRLANCQNVSCERVYFRDCPQAFFIDTASLQCGLFKCTIDYNNGIGNMTMVTLSGAENYIDSCVFRQQQRSQGGPAGCIAVLAQPGGGGYYIRNSHLSDFTTGILVQEGENLTKLFCSNIVCESWTNSLIIKPTGSSGTIHQVFCSDCIFARTNGSTDATSTGVIIDTNGGMNGNVSDIFLNNCECFQWNGPGVQINAGQNVVITGGRYGSNATSMSTSGGIAVTGAAASVTVTGADCTVKVNSPSPGYGNQPYAISVTAPVAGLYVRGCNLTGYGSNGPVYLSSAGTQIEITACAGYNDQGLVLSTVQPPGATFHNYSPWTNAPSGWFGPIAFYVKGAGNVTIDGTNTNLTDGGYTLGPGESASIAGTATHFLAVGK